MNAPIIIDTSRTFVVVRTYTRTDKKCLWSVLSRDFHSFAEADFYKVFVEEEYHREQKRKVKNPPKFFVVEQFS